MHLLALAVSFDSSWLSLTFASSSSSPSFLLFFPLFSFSIFLLLLFPAASILYTAVDGGKVSSRAYNTVVLYYCKKPINWPLGEEAKMAENRIAELHVTSCPTAKLHLCLIALANSSVAGPLAIDVINGHVNLAPITSALGVCVFGCSCRHCAFPAVCLPRNGNKENCFLLMPNAFFNLHFPCYLFFSRALLFRSPCLVTFSRRESMIMLCLSCGTRTKR